MTKTITRRTSFALAGAALASPAATAARAQQTGLPDKALKILVGFPAGGGADIGAIIAAQKLGIVDLQQDGTKYFDLHHTPDDTLDKIDKAELRQNVAAWVATLAYLANYEGELKPEPAQ